MFIPKHVISLIIVDKRIFGTPAFGHTALGRLNPYYPHDEQSPPANR